jgi:hypothetical protein
MDLGSRRWGQADENYDAIAARILTGGVDVEIGFPIVNGPNVAGLIDTGSIARLSAARRHTTAPLSQIRHR